MISVVMTSYNHEKYLALAISSVLAQTFSDFELIIVDDASVDRSQDIIRDYQEKDSRVWSIFHETNQGISRTTNEGFLAAKGDYIAYMQSDDLWLPEKLEKQLKILCENSASIVWSDAFVIDDSGNSTGQLFTERYRSTQKQKSGNIFLELVKDNYICGQSMVLESNIAKAIQFDSSLVYANDYKFMLEVAKKYDFYFIDEPLVKYRIHGDNSIHKGKKFWEKDIFKITKYILQEYATDIPVLMKARLYNRIGQYLYKRSHLQYATKFLGCSVAMNYRKTSY